MRLPLTLTSNGIADADGKLVCETRYAGSLPSRDWKRDAARIVAACNSDSSALADALLALLLASESDSLEPRIAAEKRARELLTAAGYDVPANPNQ